MARSTALAVRAASGTVTILPPLRSYSQSAVASLQAQRLDVGAKRFGDPQPIEGQERDESVLGRGAEPGDDQQRAHFVAVEADGVALEVQARAAPAVTTTSMTTSWRWLSFKAPLGPTASRAP